MSAPLWIRLPVFASGLLFAVTALAEGQLQYETVAGCPGEQDFVLGVIARGGQFDAMTFPDGQTLAVSVAKSGAGFQGWLQVRAGNTVSKRRQVHAATCADAVDALAVVAAIALRPGQTAASIPPAPASVTEPAAGPTASDLTLSPGPDSVAPARVASAALEVEAGPVRFDNVYALTLSGGLEVGVVPATPVPVLEMSIARGTFVTGPDGRGRLVGPLLRLGAGLMADVTYSAQGETTSVGGQRLTAGVCVAPIYDKRGLVVLTCANLAAGLIGTRYTSPTGAKSVVKTSGFGSLGLEVDGVYNIGRVLHLDLRVGANVLAAPITAQRDDGSEIFRSSRLAGQASLGLGAHF